MSERPELPIADAICDGGDLDCGSGLLLIIRNHLAPLEPGGVLEIRSREASVREDLPAWCRMVGHTIVATAEIGPRTTSYFLRKRDVEVPVATDDLHADLGQARSFRWRVRARSTGAMQATAYARNHVIQVGQPASFDTEDAAPSAVEVMLAGLAACLAVGLRWRASALGIEVRNLEVALNARADNILVFLGVEEDGHPGLAQIEGRAYVDADADEELLASLWQETLDRSPVAQSLARRVPIDVELRRA